MLAGATKVVDNVGLGQHAGSYQLEELEGADVELIVARALLRRRQNGNLGCERCHAVGVAVCGATSILVALLSQRTNVTRCKWLILLLFYCKRLRHG